MIRLSNWRRYGDTFQMSNLLDRRRFEKIALRRFFNYSRFITGIFNIFLNKQWPRFFEVILLVPEMGLEPIWISPFDFKSNAYTNSAIRA